MSTLRVDNLRGQTADGKDRYVVQVVEGSITSRISTASTSLTTTGLETTITPSSTSNKILISVAINGILSPETDYVVFHIYKNNVNHHSISTNVGQNGESDSSSVVHFYLDSPSTTSATTYTVYYRSGAGGTVQVGNYAIGGDGSTRSTILLQEIAQ